MSESQNERNDIAPDPETGRRPRDVPSANGPEDSEDQAAAEAIPGEQPEDNPDLEGEERFDAG